MQPELPWNVAGIPAEAREAARAAARREGLSVGDWMTRRILHGFPDVVRDANDNWRMPPSEHPARAGYPASAQDSQEMLSRISRSEVESRQAYEEIDQQLKTVAHRLDLAERHQTENSRATSEAASQIDIAAREQAQAFERMTANVTSLAGRFARLERSAQSNGIRQAIKALHLGLSRVADQIGQSASQSASQIAALAGNMDSLATQAVAANEKAEAAAHAVELHFASLDERMRTVERTASSSAAALDHTMENIEQLRADKDSVDNDLRQHGAALSEIKDAYDHLQERIGAGEEHDARLQDGLAQLEAKNAADPLDRRLSGIEHVLSGIMGRLEQTEHSSAGASGSIEQSLRDLASGFEAADQRNRDTIRELQTAVQDTAEKVAAVEGKLLEAHAAAPVPRASDPVPEGSTLTEMSSPAPSWQFPDTHAPAVASPRMILDAPPFAEDIATEHKSDPPPAASAPEEPVHTASDDVPPPPAPDMVVYAASDDVPAPPAPDMVVHAASDDVPAPPSPDAVIHAASDDVPPPPSPDAVVHADSDDGVPPPPFPEPAAADDPPAAEPVAEAEHEVLEAPESFLTAARRSAKAAAAEREKATVTARSASMGWRLPGRTSASTQPDNRGRRYILGGSIFGVAVAAALAGVVLSHGAGSSAPASRPAAGHHASAHSPVTHAPAFGRFATMGAHASSASPDLPARFFSAQNPPGSAPQKLASLAKTGDAKAQLLLGINYLEGSGAGVDEAEAARWLSRAAQQGEPLAQYRLGTLYERGRGVPASAPQAVHWYELAARQGNRKAMHNLAIALAQGSGEAKNPVQAAMWFARAANLGLADSQFNLAVLYERGMGVKQSLVDAYKWYLIAAAQGDAESKTRADALATQLGDADRAAAQQAASGFRAQPLNAGANNAPTLG